MDASKKYELIKVNQQICNTSFESGGIYKATVKAKDSMKKFKEAWEKVFPLN